MIEEIPGTPNLKKKIFPKLDFKSNAKMNLKENEKFIFPLKLFIITSSSPH